MAGLFGADEEEAGAGFGLGKEFFGEGLGYSFPGDERRGKAVTLKSSRCGWTDRGYAVRWEGLRGDAGHEGFHGIGAGEEQPIETWENRESLVEGSERGRGGGLDGGDENRLGAEGTEAVGEFGALVGAGAVRAVANWGPGSGCW